MEIAGLVGSEGGIAESLESSANGASADSSEVVSVKEIFGKAESVSGSSASQQIDGPMDLLSNVVNNYLEKKSEVDIKISEVGDSGAMSAAPSIEAAVKVGLDNLVEIQGAYISKSLSSSLLLSTSKSSESFIKTLMRSQ